MIMTKQYHDDQYLELAQTVMDHGWDKHDRTGTGTKSIFDWTMRFDLGDGSIPLLTTKEMHWHSIIHELLWFISGSTNIKYLQDNNVRIWNEWADENGDLGPVYGQQWRCWPKYESLGFIESTPGMDDHIQTFAISKRIDQIADAIKMLKHDPDNRRIMVSAWNVSDVEDMALPPCHYGFQLYTRLLTNEEREQYPGKDREVSMKMTQRSADVFLGVPFNIAQYSIMLHMFAHVCNMKPGEFIWTGGDIHIYSNHYDQIKLQLSRNSYTSPRLIITGTHKSFDDFSFDNFILKDYQSHPKIKAKVAV